MTRSARPLALVESATQLLNAAEWAHSSGRPDTDIAVLAPRDEQTLRQLGQVARLVTAAGPRVTIYPVRVPGLTGAGAVATVARAMSRSERLVIGDPFSRLIQLLLPVARAEHIVVVDDGTATWEFARCIDGGRPLVRWDRAAARAGAMSVRACRLLSPSRTRALEVFSCLSDSTPAGATEHPNRYGWARSWRRPEIADGEIDLLGTSLVDTGLVQRTAYLSFLARLARTSGPIRYLAHRRESEESLARVATIPGMHVHRLPLPVELALRHGPVARRVVTFPSTAAHSLPIVLGDLGVDIAVEPIDPAWFVDGTSQHARDVVARIAQRVPLRPRTAA